MIRSERRIGKEIACVIEGLGELRMKVFYEFPYLYEGNMDYEKAYLSIYTKSKLGFAFLLYDNNELIGATTGLPLAEEGVEIKKPFLDAGIDINDVFYFGESILLQAYRGQGFGHLFFDEREAFARTNKFPITAFCSVVRPENHALKPRDYRSNELFWKKRQYIRNSDLICKMSWLDRNQVLETEKELEFWLRKWS